MPALWNTSRSGRRTAVSTPCEIVSIPIVAPMILGRGQPASMRALFQWPYTTGFAPR